MPSSRHQWLRDFTEYLTWLAATSRAVNDISKPDIAYWLHCEADAFMEGPKPFRIPWRGRGEEVELPPTEIPPGARLFQDPIAGDRLTWRTLVAWVDGAEAIAAISSYAERRTISVELGGDALDGHGDAVRGFARPTGDAPAGGHAPLWELLVGRVGSIRAMVYGTPPLELAAQQGSRGDTMPKAILIRGLDLALDDGSGEGWGFAGYRWGALAWTAAAARAAAAAAGYLPRFHGRPGEPCPRCAAPLVDPRAHDNPGHPGGGDADWVEARDIELACGGCGARFATDLVRRYWFDSGVLEYERG